MCAKASVALTRPMPYALECNSVVPEVKIAFIFSVEFLIKSHKVITVQSILTMRRYIVNGWYMLSQQPQVKQATSRKTCFIRDVIETTTLPINPSAHNVFDWWQYLKISLYISLSCRWQHRRQMGWDCTARLCT